MARAKMCETVNLETNSTATMIKSSPLFVTLDSIQIFGPGEAKGELEKRLEHEGLKEHILAIETMDKMTDRQIAAKVRERFPV